MITRASNSDNRNYSVTRRKYSLQTNVSFRQSKNVGDCDDKEYIMEKDKRKDDKYVFSKKGYLLKLLV